MKKILKAVCLMLCMAAYPALAEETGKDDNNAYLFVFHQDPTSSLYMATSIDGYTFTALNNAQPIMSGDTLATQHGIRDPHIYQLLFVHIFMV